MVEFLTAQPSVGDTILTVFVWSMVVLVIIAWMAVIVCGVTLFSPTGKFLRGLIKRFRTLIKRFPLEVKIVKKHGRNRLRIRRRSLVEMNIDPLRHRLNTLLYLHQAEYLERITGQIDGICPICSNHKKMILIVKENGLVGLTTRFEELRARAAWLSVNMPHVWRIDDPVPPPCLQYWKVVKRVNMR